MKQDPFAGVYRALSPKELAEMFMNPNAPKTEAEHWAAREIEKLRAEVERLRAENDEKQALIDAARAHRNNLRAEIERTHALLKDPNAVAINMLRGVIALPSADQIRHIYQQTPEAQP